MKNIYKLALAIVLFLSANTMNSQMTCLTPSLGIYDATTWAPMSATVPCTYTNIINISPTQFAVGNQGTSPCMRIIIGLTNANAASNNSIAIGEGTNNPIYNMCPSGCSAVIPNSSSYTMSLFYLDPGQNHGYNLCNTNIAANMNYTIASCYSNVPLASGVWNNTVAGGCQTVNIPANSPIGIAGYIVSPAVPSTASISTGDANLYLDTYQMAQGVYTITYFFNSQSTCSVTSTRTISITNPYTASWTALGPLCSNGTCVNLNPQITGSSGGTFTATAGVSSNSFCPSTSGAGTFAVTYTVGVSPQCGRTASNNIVVNPTPTANAGTTQNITCVNSTVSLSGSGGPSYNWSGPGIISGGTTANPVVGSPGNYSLTVTSGGCTSAPSVVLVGSNTTPPSVIASSSGSITCVNTVINLFSNPAGMTYSWTAPAGSSIVGGVNNQNTMGSGPGTYTVMVVNPVNGCGSIATVAAMTNTSAPIVTVNTSNTLICTPQSATLTAGGASSYTWSTSSNSQTIVVSPTVTTSYTVIGTGVSGCTNTAAFTQSVSTCAGLTELSNNNGVNIFPNPTNGQFTLLFNKVKEKAEVKVVNAIGQVVLRKTISSADKINLNISEQASGVYFVEVNADGESYRTKIVKE